MQEHGFYSHRQVVAVTSLSPATIYRMRRTGEFPEPVRISKGRVGYPKNVIQDWIAERMGGLPHAA